ncbi:hypothetical protein COC96_19435 [Bacillus cereus]|nr:hypothetical protein COC96_19435 [Bacillus cereus]
MNRIIEKGKGRSLLLQGVCLFLSTDNDNYVNKLSIWTAYCMFLLSVVFFQNASGTPSWINFLQNMYLEQYLNLNVIR